MSARMKTSVPSTTMRPEQLVEIEQPVADQVLRQEVEVDDDEDVAEARPVRARPRAAPAVTVAKPPTSR